MKKNKTKIQLRTLALVLTVDYGIQNGSSMDMNRIISSNHHHHIRDMILRDHSLLHSQFRFQLLSLGQIPKNQNFS